MEKSKNSKTARKFAGKRENSERDGAEKIGAINASSDSDHKRRFGILLDDAVLGVKIKKK